MLEVFNVTGNLNLSFSNLMALSTLIQVFVVFVAVVVQDMFFLCSPCPKTQSVDQASLEFSGLPARFCFSCTGIEGMRHHAHLLIHF